MDNLIHINPRLRTEIPALIDSDYIRIPFHETSGTAIAQSSTDILSSSLTLSGTVDTDQYTNAPMFTWSPTATDANYIADATTLATQKAFCDLSTDWSDFIIVFRLYVTTLTPSAEEFIVSNSMSGAGDDAVNGGWAVQITTSNTLVFRTRFSAIVGYAPVTLAEIGGGGSDISVLYHLKKGGAVTAYINGVTAGVAGDLSGVTTYPACSENAGLVIGARSRVGQTPVHFLGAGGSGARTAEHWLIRTTSDKAAYVPTLAMELTTNPMETPLVLENF